MNYWFSWVLDCHPIWGVTLKCVFCEIRWAHLISELRMYSANAFFQVVADQRRGQTFNRWTKWMVTHQTNFSWQTSLFLEMSSSPEFVGHHSPMISFSLFSRPNGPSIILRCPWKEEHIEVVSEVCYLCHRFAGGETHAIKKWTQQGINNSRALMKAHFYKNMFTCLDSLVSMLSSSARSLEL